MLRRAVAGVFSHNRAFPLGCFLSRSGEMVHFPPCLAIARSIHPPYVAFLCIDDLVPLPPPFALYVLALRGICTAAFGVADETRLNSTRPYRQMHTRHATTTHRKTNETAITVDISLDGTGKAEVRLFWIPSHSVRARVVHFSTP